MHNNVSPWIWIKTNCESISKYHNKQFLVNHRIIIVIHQYFFAQLYDRCAWACANKLCGACSTSLRRYIYNIDKIVSNWRLILVGRGAVAEIDNVLKGGLSRSKRTSISSWQQVVSLVYMNMFIIVINCQYSSNLATITAFVYIGSVYFMAISRSIRMLQQINVLGNRFVLMLYNNI